jgi:uncharacterized Zn finger protein (UPF0148 family)
MSDFDKEAEREKLREKFAKDDQKRERTSRMSELLLKGATMTNKHHDCGSPIFRWEGQEFCPTCQGAPDGEGVAEVEADADGERETADATAVDVESPAESADQPTPETANGTPEAAEQSPTRTPEHSPEPTPTPEPRAQSPAPAPSQPTTGTGRSGDLAAARASLTRTLTSLAERAEATDDVSKQRDLLAAVEDAAEALEATKRADR